MRRSALALALLLVASASPALAHAPFLQPLNFAPSRDYVTVIGGMHEETAFVADFAIRPGDLWVVGPDGARTRLDGQATVKGVTAVDVPLLAAGTYKVTTGDRIGREATMAQVGGVWRMVRPAVGPGGGPGGARPGGGERGEGPPPIAPADVPAGAPTIKTTGVLKAETYVTKGKPSTGALKPMGQGFELEPISHPNEVYLDKGFRFRLLDDGKPVAGVPVLVRRGDEAYAVKKTETTVTTDAHGEALFKPTLPGAYALQARSPAPAGGAPAARSTTLVVSIEATP